MKSVDEITVFINAIREFSGVGICYYDLNSFFHYDRYGILNNRGHYCEFCKKTRELPNGRAYCDKSDRAEAVLLAKQYKEPFFYECHMHMRELVVPLLHNDELQGILFVGQCRTEHDCYSNMQAAAERIGGDPQEFLSLYNELPYISQKDLLHLGNVLSCYFHAIMRNNELLTAGTATYSDGDDLSHKIKSYINYSYRNHITPGEIASTFHVNASYASRCFSQKYKMSITDYINSIRIKHAKALLRDTDASIANIALNVGFKDLNYFSRVFRKVEGMSPSQFRKK